MKKITPIEEKNRCMKIKKFFSMFFPFYRTLFSVIPFAGQSKKIYYPLAISLANEPNHRCVSITPTLPFILAESSVIFEVPSYIQLIHMKRDRPY